MTKRRELKFSLIRALFAILIALFVAAVLIFISAEGAGFEAKLDASFKALQQLLIGPLFRTGKNGIAFDARRLADVLATMTPIIFTGLSVCIMFSANQFNLGAEGGVMLGAFVAAMIAIYVPLPAGIHPVAAASLGGLVGAVVMLIPAMLKIRLDVSEMVNSLMLNYIIMYIIRFVMNSYLSDKSKGQIQTESFLESARIHALSDSPVFTGAKLTRGFVIAIVAVILCALFMYRTRWGYTMRMIGVNQDFAGYTGMNVSAVIVLSQLLGGFLAGAGGGIEMLGRYTAFSWSSLPGYGWTGITIAILAGNNPLMVPVAAFFMAYLSKGCELMATYARVPAQLIDIIQGIIFLFFAAEQFLRRYRQKLVIKSAQYELDQDAKADAEEGGTADA